MSVTVEDVLSRLDGVAQKGGYWIAKCPVHDDRRASLSVKVANGDGHLPDGAIIVKCHAGCAKEDVVAALGLDLSDLMPSKKQAPRIVAEYDYTDENGRLLYQAVRMVPKDFRVRRPDPSKKSGWHWSLPKDHRRVLYRLPDVLSQAERGGWVFVVEGEKDADAIHALGLVATTSVGGAGKWRDTYARSLMGARVAILPDNDTPGAKHAQQVAASVDALTAGCATVLDLPDLPEKGDASDWIRAGGTADQLVRLAERNPRWEPPKRGDQEAIEEEVFGRELWMARRVVDRHGNDVRYVGPWKKWLSFNGRGVWEHDQTGHVERAIKSEADRLVDECVRDMQYGGMAQKRRDGKERLDLALDFYTAAKQGSVERLARTETKVVADVDQWDANPWLLSLQNGTLDLRTLEVRRARREDYITKQASVEYRPNAQCPTWERFLREVIPSANVRAYIQRAVGYALTGVIREHVIQICWGDGANGKTTFWEAIAEMLGDYAGPAPESLLMQDGRTQHETELTVLHGKRLVIVSETPEGGRMNENRMKRITGGDRIMARRMREDHWTFAPTHKLVMFTNHKPRIRSVDHGTWRRLRLIPFTVKIPDERIDLKLPEKLRGEFPGILNWAIKGCQDWHTGGLRPPAEVDTATGDWAHSEDLVGQWIAERTRKADTFVSSTELYRDFKAWAEEEGEQKIIGQRTLSSKLQDRGLEYVRSPTRGFRGIRLATPYEIAHPQESTPEPAQETPSGEVRTRRLI